MVVCAVMWYSVCVCVYVSWVWARRNVDYCEKQRRREKSDAKLATFISMMTLMMLMLSSFFFSVFFFCFVAALVICQYFFLFSFFFFLVFERSVFVLISCYFMYIKFRERARVSLTLPTSLIIIIFLRFFSHSLSFYLFHSLIHCERTQFTIHRIFRVQTAFRSLLFFSLLQRLLLVVAMELVLWSVVPSLLFFVFVYLLFLPLLFCVRVFVCSIPSLCGKA